MNKWILAIIFIFLFGCASERDVTFNQDYNFGYEKGQIYKSKRKLYIIDAENPYLVVPGEIYPSILTYRKSPGNYRDITGVADINTKLKVNKLIYQNAFEGSYLDVFAVIISGEYIGKQVKLNLISKLEYKSYPDGGTIPVPEPNILENIISK